MSVKLLTEHHLEFLGLKGGCTSSSKSTLVKMPHCWKSHTATQIFFRHFVVKDKNDVAEAAKIFSVPDFVGDACKAIASRVRGSVAQVQFDDFHKVK